jgi:hypothetical protein
LLVAVAAVAAVVIVFQVRVKLLSSPAVVAVAAV